MGDRANIKIKEAQGGVIYLYTHWQGYKWPQMLQKALKYAKDRWDDESYLTRCIITQMCADADGPTGYGVSTWLGDGDYNVTELDHASQKVKLRDGTEYTFEEFLTADLGPVEG